MKALLLVALTACAAQPVGEIGIACTTDDECPSDTWCDLRYDETCRSLDSSGPPNIVFEGFLAAGDTRVPTITVPSQTLTIRSFVLRNDGRSQTDVTVDLAAQPCVDADSLVRSDGVLVDEGESFEADFSVWPAAGCTSPATLAITAKASRRTFTFTAMISFSP